ncbi:hypothetical protein ACFX1Q_039934 [Malus domestica]
MLMARSEVKCYCCGLTEECTPAYVATVKKRHQDRWICGLCAEAIKDENSRSSRKISTEEAMRRHVSFCEEFRICTRLHQVNLIVPGSEENGPSLVPNQALRDSSLAKVLRHRSALLQHRVRAQDLGDDRVAAGLRLEQLDLGEHGLP